MLAMPRYVRRACRLVIEARVFLPACVLPRRNISRMLTLFRAVTSLPH